MRSGREERGLLVLRAGIIPSLGGEGETLHSPGAGAVVEGVGALVDGALIDADGSLVDAADALVGNDALSGGGVGMSPCRAGGSVRGDAR
jgi:hypothetical protein